MKKLFTLFAFAAMASTCAFSEGTGIYLTGTMNDWAENDPAWELQEEPNMPGWGSIDLTDFPAGTEFKIVGFGRTYGMKNNRNTINQNSMHTTTLDGSYKLTACAQSLDGVHLLVQTEDFEVNKFVSILTITDASIELWGACMESSVTPTLLVADETTPDVVSADVNVTEAFYIVKAYELSNATQTVVNYGISDTVGVLEPTSFLTPTAAPIPMPADGAGVYTVRFNTETFAYQVGEESSVDKVAVTSPGEEVYYNLQGVRVDSPVKGNVYILVRDGKASKIAK